MRLLLILSMIQLFIADSLFGQGYEWPINPFDQQHNINGTFCENRPSGSILRDHFHSGVDIHAPQGMEVYSVVTGVVSGRGSLGSANAWIRVGNYAYVHVEPEPSLAIGDSVFGYVTTIGRTNDQNHIHFIQGQPGAQENPLLSNGLKPFTDNLYPVISYIEFYVDGTDRKFEGNNIQGKVDIVARAMDVTDTGPIGANNGIYKIGFQIFDSTRTELLLERTPYIFDTKPPDDRITLVYSMGSDLSTYIYRVSNNLNRNNFWDTDTFPKGEYHLLVHTTDTQANSDTLWTTVNIVDADTIAPMAPRLKSVGTLDDDSFRMSWYPNSEEDLLGYQLEYSFDNTDWIVLKDKSELSDTATIVNFPLTVPSPLLFFRLLAFDDAPFTNKSYESDVYGFYRSVNFDKMLVVDGFDRRDGAWTSESHRFAASYGNILKSMDISFDVAANESVEESFINLNNYTAVIWLLGDESVTNETLSAIEQDLIIDYLSSGGRLFLTGSELAFDLDPDGNSSATTADELFLHDYIGVNYSGRSTDFEAQGNSMSNFNGLNFSFGEREYILMDYNTLELTGEALSAFENSAGDIIGVSNEVGSSGGKIVYLASPFENISRFEDQYELLKNALIYFDITVGLEDEQNVMPKSIMLSQNYPNPFNPVTVIEYALPKSIRVTFVIYNLSGKEVSRLVDAEQSAGNHKIIWDASNVASGIYLYRLKAGDFVRTRKMILLK